MKGRTILITGVTGKAALPIAAALARDNQVFGLSRFGSAHERQVLESLGIIPCQGDLASEDLSMVPRGLDYLLHFGWMRASSAELDAAMKVNVEGTGFLLDRVRPVRGALVVSSSAVYRGEADPRHVYRVGDPIGVGPSVAAETSAICKIAMESVARVAALSLGLRMTIARLNTVHGPHQAFYGKKVSAVLADQMIVLPSANDPHNPIHVEDLIWQVEPLLDAAGLTPLTLNWSGDEVIKTRSVIDRIAARTGYEPRVEVRSIPGLAGGNVTDPAPRKAITGPCRIGFDGALDRMLDEMLDGLPTVWPQRDWAYASPTQNRVFEGPGETEP